VIAGNFSECASHATARPDRARPARRTGQPDAADRAEVLEGLMRPQKSTPAKLLYDARGSELFERICALPEYYVTRAEIGAIRRHLPEIADTLGQDLLVIEPGAGAAHKVRYLLGIPRLAAGYVPVEICHSTLQATVTALRAAYPAVEVRGLCADFMRPFDVPATHHRHARRLVFFPGSTIGNCTPPEAVALLGRLRRLAGGAGALLVGVDLYKAKELLLPAYNDSAGVTAQFNLNVLHRLNRDFSADFRVERFSHRAVWNEAEHRIEMRLVSRADQQVHVGPHLFDFAAGEYLTTEYSYKHTTEEFARIAHDAGLAVQKVWTDCAGHFSLQYLRAAD
jgi:dimethylhistidine N-methyltransferase